MSRQIFKVAIISSTVAALAFCVWFFTFEKSDDPFSQYGYEAPLTIEPPKGLPPIPWPEDNPYSPEKAELGRLLFFDKRLSSNGTISCASCHVPRRAFADENLISIGIHGHAGTRHAPTVINTAYNRYQFWDGRANTLEEQCVGPLANRKEMTSALEKDKALQECHERVCEIKGYRELFKRAFGNDECSVLQIAQAISTFERTVLSGNAPYDRYMLGDKSAMTKEQVRGMEVFRKASCAFCHTWPKFTDDMFTNIGVGMDKPNPDLGRYDITKKDSDWGAFKVPTLRECASSYPYMHDGSQATLEEVIDYYDKGGFPNRNQHPQIRPLHLSPEDKKALIAFLHALSGEGFEHVKEPLIYPE